LLTPRNLTLLRAALKYFDEEMSPHGLDTAAAYFDEPMEPALSPAEIRALREYLAQCEVKYVLCAQDGSRIQNDQLTNTLEAAQALTAPLPGTIAAVLLPRRDRASPIDLP
jgi:hypothetical protein